ncbi:1,4-alpha-glucan branching protein [Actinomadura sp. NAK00032]|uniref:maltokinase N-terminal cap-like domain-containing protein n=1 Tax=Actinomadura sp. NAK00032 TaxID=2742128 RepID=UPI00159201B8|nr:1,4-alpha-glucan branching protein [Actinomadura sp. NAK00032]QKW39146.1 1,4-alpha-glucan branching protein [Actinomadura sp. NAK00032]
MAVIYETTMTPGKLELLTAWLPTQPWYAGPGPAPRLAKAGGFRLDDPDGEVGMEFMVVTDTSGDRPVTYHAPLSYRGAALDGAEEGLVGTSEHGVLGRRWVYDGTRDPVLVAQLLALLQGRAEPQHQTSGGTPDPSVSAHFTEGTASPLAAITAIENGPDGTAITVATEPSGTLTIGVARVLHPHNTATDAQTHVTAPWRTPDGTEHRAPFAVLR